MLGNKGDNEPEEVFLNLTPMINIMCCLLFFLLLGYRSQALMLEGAQGLELPLSTSEKGLIASLTVSVTQKEIKLMDSHVMFLNNGEVPAAELEGQKILPLYNRVFRIIQLKKMDPDKSFVLLLADKRLKSDVINKVMKTCGMAGLPNFRFGVSKP